MIAWFKVGRVRQTFIPHSLSNKQRITGDSGVVNTILFVTQRKWKLQRDDSRLSLVWWLFLYQWRNSCMFWRVPCLAWKYFIFLPISQLAAMKQLDDSLLLTKNTKNTRKTKTSEINLQSKHDLIWHVVKVKVARWTYSMDDVIPFLVYCIY